MFLTFSCIGYAMPFILCATICCCLPCIISVLGFREDHSQTRGATTESINSLPTYKFKLKRNEINDDQDSNTTAEGGLLAAGTEKERAILEEDAVCMFGTIWVFFLFLIEPSEFMVLEINQSLTILDPLPTFYINSGNLVTPEISCSFCIPH